jgi:protein tyrosine/serine phosphatase
VCDLRRVLEVDGLVNARDLGGLPLTCGGTTPRGVFFRSENLDAITPNGWRQLRDAGIRTVVDLRQPGERERDHQPRPEWLVTTHVDLDGLENTDFWAGYWDNGLVGTALYFLPHLAAMPERTGTVLTALAEATDGGVLFHCMGGRDRTGMVSMVLLSIAGVEAEAIVDDYLETVRLGDIRAASANRNNDEARIDELLAGHGTTTEQAFRDALAGLDLTTLLSAAGVSGRSQQVLRTWRGRLPSRRNP